MRNAGRSFVLLATLSLLGCSKQQIANLNSAASNSGSSAARESEEAGQQVSEETATASSASAPRSNAAPTCGDSSDADFAPKQYGFSHVAPAAIVLTDAPSNLDAFARWEVDIPADATNIVFRVAATAYPGARFFINGVEGFAQTPSAIRYVEFRNLAAGRNELAVFGAITGVSYSSRFNSNHCLRYAVTAMDVLPRPNRIPVYYYRDQLTTAPDPTNSALPPVFYAHAANTPGLLNIYSSASDPSHFLAETPCNGLDSGVVCQVKPAPAPRQQVVASVNQPAYFPLHLNLTNIGDGSTYYKTAEYRIDGPLFSLFRSLPGDQTSGMVGVSLCTDAYGQSTAVLSTNAFPQDPVPYQSGLQFLTSLPASGFKSCKFAGFGFATQDPVFDTDRGFVKDVLARYLGRDGLKDDLDYWIPVLRNYNRWQIERWISTSAESVNRVYLELLDRPLEPNQTAWTNMGLVNGFRQMQWGIGMSDEAKAVHDRDADSFVALVHSDCVIPTYDGASATTISYMDIPNTPYQNTPQEYLKLYTRMELKDVMCNKVGSISFLDQITYLYEKCLGRRPEQAALTGWGSGIVPIIGISTSAEAGIFANNVIKQSYLELKHRSPSAADLALTLPPANACLNLAALRTAIANRP